MSQLTAEKRRAIRAEVSVFGTISLEPIDVRELLDAIDEAISYVDKIGEYLHDEDYNELRKILGAT